MGPNRQAHVGEDIEDGNQEDIRDFKEEGNKVPMVWKSRGINGRGSSWRPPQNFGSIKMKMPPFLGKNDLELYLEYEKKLEHIFEYHNYE